MDPTTLTASALRGIASSGAKVLLSGYRPSGVPRTGSPEDRAGAYQRFLDATVRRMRTTMRVHDVLMSDVLNGKVPPEARTWALGMTDQWRDAEDDFLCALMAVRLCGTSYVTATADHLFSVLEKIQLKYESDVEWEAAYQSGLEEFATAQRAFLEAARHDLAYNPKWWQFLRRWRERQYRRMRESISGRRGPAAP